MVFFDRTMPLEIEVIDSTR